MEVVETITKINREKTKAEIISEMQELKPYINTHPDQAEKFANLWVLYHSLNGNDDGVRVIADRTKLNKFVYFESCG